MTVEIEANKYEAKFRILVENRPETLSEIFDGFIHLFEHQYDSNTLFWYGVAEITCDPDVYRSTMQIGSPEAFAISVNLEDGRRGLARHFNSHSISDLESDYMKVSMFGCTKLEIP